MSDNTRDKQGTTRRQAFGAAALVATIGAAASASAADKSSASGSPKAQAGDRVVTTPRDSITQTADGSVRGFKRSGVHVFRGIPYGAPIVGEARYAPPKPPAKWQGERWCTIFGVSSPQAGGDSGPRPVQSFAENQANQRRSFANETIPTQEGDDCLMLNVWSTALNPTAKKPVMVWLHGGGFTSGAGSDFKNYDGTNLALRGVVLVSLNHRLGPIGFMDLTGIGGDAYRGSGNAGMLDIVQALKWVRDNIASFGGDPGNVTIFGQSGGGGKVSTLMAMPSAQGLFHRAIVMSGSFASGISQKDARALTAATMAELGLAPNDIAGLRATAPEKVIAAGNAASRKMPTTVGVNGPRTIGFGPVIDGDVLPAGWQNGAPKMSASVPMIVGNVRDEFRDRTTPINSDADIAKIVPAARRDKAPEIIAALRKTYPNHPSVELAAIAGGMGMRQQSVRQAELKYALGGAPVYSYWFAWPSPLFDGDMGCGHGQDIGPAFNNTELCDQYCGNSPDVRKIASIMSKAFVNFAATGNPSQPGYAWPAFEPTKAQTMVFDTPVRVESDPAGQARRLMA